MGSDRSGNIFHRNRNDSRRGSTSDRRVKSGFPGAFPSYWRGKCFGAKDNPIVPEATLHIYIGAHDFGTSSGGGGFPNDPVDALGLRIYAVFNMANTVLLQSNWLKLDSIQIQSNGWIAKTDGGLLQQNYYFAIPHSISPGKHNAQMPIEADDKWWGSHSFRIEVPKR